MKTIRMISMAVLIVSIAGLMMWRFVVPFSDWVVRVVGVLLLVSTFTAVFSTLKMDLD